MRRISRRNINVRNKGAVPALIVGLVATLMVVSCSGDAPNADEGVAQVQQALGSNDSILGFEGPVGGAAAAWTAGSGTAAGSSNAAYSGAHALSLSGNTNASAVSAKITTLGPVASTATIQVSLPSSLQGQGWFGQIALYFNAPSAGVYNQYAGPVPLSGALGQYKSYPITIPSGVVTALSTKTYTDLTITVQLNVPSTSGAFLIDELCLSPTSDAGLDASDARSDADASLGNGGSTGSGTSAGSGSGASTGTGGSGVGGAQGAGGTTGLGGNAGTSTTGTGAGGSASTGAGGGSSSAGGTSGPGGGASGTTVDFFFKLPNGVRREDVVFATTGGDLNVDDGVKLLEGAGFASVSSVDGGKVNRIGVAGQAFNVWSDGSVTLANNALIHGSIATSGTVSAQAGAVVTGTTKEHATLGPLQELLDLARQYGREQGAERIIVEGARRTTSSMAGKVPRPWVLDVNE